MFAASLLASDHAHAKTIRVDAPSRQMSVNQAKKLLVESLGYLQYIESVEGVKFSRQSVAFVANYMPERKKRLGRAGLGASNAVPCSITFSELKDLAVSGNTKFSRVVMNGKPLAFDATFETQNAEAALDFVDALLILKAAASRPDTEEADFATFTAGAQAWLATTPKPEMSDEALTYKVLAEEAFKKQNYPEALEFYAKALDRHPFWPSGQYNAALLAAENEDYELGALYMRRYLVLAPDAKDAGAAKEKLLLWQHKAQIIPRPPARRPAISPVR